MRRAPKHVDGDCGLGRRQTTPRRDRHRDQRGSKHDAGYSLIEIVATITVMSIIMAPLFSGVIASIRASTYTRNTAQVLTTLANAADRVNRAGKSCDYATYAAVAVKSIGWSPTQASVQQSYYTAGTSPTVAGIWSPPSAIAKAACPSGGLSALLVQKVIITVTSPDGKISRKIEVIKSDI